MNIGQNTIEVQEIPLITVITPSYHSPDLYVAIDSVIGQDYPHIEYLLIDDGTPNFSTQAVTQYIENHRGKNLETFRVISNPENLGTVRTMNIGLHAATGEYIFNLAGDDAFADTRVLSDWVNTFQRTGAVFMTAYRDIYDERLEQCFGRLPDDRQVKKIRNLTPQQLFEEITGENFIFGCCTAQSRKISERYGYYNEQYRLIEDYPATLRLLRQGLPVVFFDRTVVKHRGNGASAVTNYNPFYEQESDRIFKNEVLPYTTNPDRARRNYRKWKKKQRRDREFQAAMLRAQGHPLRIFFLRLWRHAHTPLTTLRTILKNPGKLKKLFAK